ncbi:glutamate-5-semialdehyde dehydrogenase [Corynebacterium uberis]|uniref:glutamate-5-semialdehyde dehydrogenase n=1 Tax=Corynebacterium TaxID=1716 RepID=UPI001D0A0F2A|nr:MULTISPECIES: glutamate-5-semialdehyde dehydrogenase [Corynebacterium]MCZ9310083.1 glutamate-5-semialdehyde dehydrogenase [Corynebacterium sp. c6VSa_13]UDL73829.1 glutamate-5-semialdehyde dehydrogenase [Corynebacterium uberis]UDL75287.1 glutamate-5-semialdehyde dehydrogenase [Corynebacterium uberis]UDL77498.1 glutamate-5-semialdehyde dehydrogenase [Corynebacterium uberis]UDL79785.1 glutamate-5-semialdehyde dehydrogenase [Corynebacterium uberis]
MTELPAHTPDPTLSDEPQQVLRLARAARAVAPIAAGLSSATKNAVLAAAAQALEDATDAVLKANDADVAAGQRAGMDAGLIDRLRLDATRLRGIADGLRQVAGLEDPVGQVVAGRVLANGIRMRQVRVPLGVMGMVYEARPNVTVDAFGLALKSGNVALLRGSKSARHTNEALVEVLRGVLVDAGLPADLVSLLPSQTHDSVQALITARGLVDVVIPRGSARLINAVVEGASVPAIETGTGNCHLYIDASADLEQAVALLINGKTRRPSVCNATETVLLDSALSDASVRTVATALREAGVTIHGQVSQWEDRGVDGVVPATEEDWAEEYLSMDIAAGFVDGVEGAIAHIARWSSGHTEAIAARDYAVTQRFAAAVDSAAVNINASTAFTDGEVYGMGAEIGISTQKLHARGPMALPELTSTKWILEGDGQVRP